MSIQRFGKIKKGIGGATNALRNGESTGGGGGISQNIPVKITQVSEYPAEGIIIPRVIKKIKVPNILSGGVGISPMKHHQYFMKHIDIDNDTFITIDKMNNITYIRSKKTFEFLRSIPVAVHAVHGNYAVYSNSTSISVYDIRTATVVATINVTANNGGTSPNCQAYPDISGGNMGKTTADCNISGSNSQHTLHHPLGLDVYVYSGFVYVAIVVSETVSSATQMSLKLMKAAILGPGISLVFAEFLKTAKLADMAMSVKLYLQNSKVNIQMIITNNNGGNPQSVMSSLTCPNSTLTASNIETFYTHGSSSFANYAVLEDLVRLPHPTTQDHIVYRRRSQDSAVMRAPQEIGYAIPSTISPFPATINAELCFDETRLNNEIVKCAMPMYVSGYNCIMISNLEMRIFQRIDKNGRFSAGSLFRFKEKCNPVDMFKPMFIDNDGSIYASKVSEFNMGEECIYKLEIYES